MTLDEAYQILDVKDVKWDAEESLAKFIAVRLPATPPCATRNSRHAQNYERIFKQNETSSHYLLSKVARAKLRIEAEMAAERERCDLAVDLAKGLRRRAHRLGGQGPPPTADAAPPTS